MGILRKINQFFGFISILSIITVIINTIITRNTENDLIFYYGSMLFIVFGALFLLTAVIFVLYDLIVHIRNKQFVLFIRHYLYAFVGFYLLCILADYVLNGIIDWPGYAHYALGLALIQTYISGFRTSASAPKKESAA